MCCNLKGAYQHPYPEIALRALGICTSVSSAQAQQGEVFYTAACASCHGTDANGKEGIAPPLVYRIYEVSHHGEMAFVLAARNGVRAHHWAFGNMPPSSSL